MTLKTDEIDEDALYYDIPDDSFTKLLVMDDGETVAYIEPESGDEFHHEPIAEVNLGDFVKVFPQAVERPSTYLDRAVEKYVTSWSAGDNEQMRKRVSLRYAYSQCEIVETEDA